MQAHLVLQELLANMGSHGIPDGGSHWAASEGQVMICTCSPEAPQPTLATCRDTAVPHRHIPARGAALSHALVTLGCEASLRGAWHGNTVPAGYSHAPAGACRKPYLRQ